MGADYLFELNSIETYAPQFFGHNNLFLGSVHCMVPCLKRRLCTVIFDHYKALSVPQAINNVGRNAPNYAPKDNRLLLHEIT